jgi:hypothetical protein
MLEEVVPMEYVVPNLRIEAFTGMDDSDVVQDRLAQLLELKEDRFIVGFHQHVQKEREKDYHDRHIKKKSFKQGYLVSDLGRVTCECLGPVGPWLCKKEKIKEERKSMKCVEGTQTKEGSKWLKKQKRRNEVKEKQVVEREDQGR